MRAVECSLPETDGKKLRVLEKPHLHKKSKAWSHRNLAPLLVSNLPIDRSPKYSTSNRNLEEGLLVRVDPGIRPDVTTPRLGCIPEARVALVEFTVRDE